MAISRKVLLMSALIAASAVADARDHVAEVHVGVGRTLMGAELDDATNYNLGIGYVLSNRWTLELIASEYESNLPGSSVDVRGTQYRLDALYHFGEGKWRPYASFGAGNQRLSPDGGTPHPSHQDMVNFGLGLKGRLAKSLEWRTEVRAFNSVDEHFTDVVFGTGVSFLFGHQESKPAAAPKPAPAPAVDPDSDGDGVPDSRDKCPDTPRQYKVDADGCPMELTQAVSIDLAVTFDSDSAVVKDAFLPEVKKVAEFMNQYLNTQVTVEGHTDSTGSAAHNKALSQRRADSVRETLIKRFNIAPERVKAVGYGQDKPVASNATVEGRGKNRRVVAEISTDVTRKVTR
ncbi:OmpA family protein [Cellvibrio polysaccharolyticus]|uniref:OmpA family protein n=1 Tax=Cellvibrio polysaccharolyticus TaxID=2082724 RepID=A0A928V7Y0_9GAMM|nr:OmpA family protein [Cellvibrio polysaccharolyticus]MBE8718775.1 OmpA family protein [Cellvibrio polysaccharolyticus]